LFNGFGASSTNTWPNKILQVIVPTTKRKIKITSTWKFLICLKNNHTLLTNSESQSYIGLSFSHNSCISKNHTNYIQGVMNIHLFCPQKPLKSFNSKNHVTSSTCPQIHAIKLYKLIRCSPKIMDFEQNWKRKRKTSNNKTLTDHWPEGDWRLGFDWISPIG